jgi:hypothetical protein
VRLRRAHLDDDWTAVEGWWLIGDADLRQFPPS